MTPKATRALVRHAMKETGLSRREFARAVGVSEHTVGRWLAGTSNIRSILTRGRIREVQMNAIREAQP